MQCSFPGRNASLFVRRRLCSSGLKVFFAESFTKVCQHLLRGGSSDEELHLQSIPPENIRNFGIIAHIDHGKSTLADRLLEMAGCIPPNSSHNPVLDALPVERARGITVKAQTASMIIKHQHDVFLLNLIDTPGHADFTNEVSRSLAAMQGALLVVDAAAGVQAQTVAHYWRAREAGVEAIIPVINKVDLPTANVDATLKQLDSQLGLDVLNLSVLCISAKSGLGIASLIPAIIERIPPPSPAAVEASLEAQLIDSWYRDFRGVICMIYVRAGRLRTGATIRSAVNDKTYTVDEVGLLQPDLIPTDYLHAGQVGYIRCGIKSVQEAMVGDTFFDPSLTRLPHLRLPKKMRPIVYAGMFPVVREAYEDVSDAVEKLRLNDSSVEVEKIVSVALGSGWRLGFLGSLHMDVFRQRLEQEFGVHVLMTAPSVSYEMIFKGSDEVHPITSAEQYPSDKMIARPREFREPLVKATIICPTSCFGPIAQLCSDARCGRMDVEYLCSTRAKLSVELPLIEIIGEFNDRLLSLSAGYASLDYEPSGSRPVELVKIGIKLNGEPVDILSTVQPRERADSVGRAWVRRLAEMLPRQQFAVAIQAVVGSKVIARENVAAMRKDVIAKCYGGDKTRKMKLLEAQKAGKERMRMFGKVEIPHDIFVSIMRLGGKADRNTKD